MESFFERPILNSPYAYPDRHWELDDDGQPTNKILPKRRESKFLTPVPKPQKRRRTASPVAASGEPRPMAGDARNRPATPTLAASSVPGHPPFFCQVEAVETAIWLTEVAPKRGQAVAKFWAHIRAANEQSNPELVRIALKTSSPPRLPMVWATDSAWR
jgi:type III restriction enzyme